MAWGRRWWQWLRSPEQDFLGIEVHSPGVGACLASAHEEGLSNLRVMCHDAVEVLHKMIPDNSLRMVQLFFPDPWHKARHNKRRIVQGAVCRTGKSKLQLGAYSIWRPTGNLMQEHMLEVMSSIDGYKACQRAMITYRVRHHVR